MLITSCGKIFGIDYRIVECEVYMTLGALEAAFRGLVLNLLMDLFFNISRFSTSSCYSCNVCLFIYWCSVSTAILNPTTFQI